ncbi:MAG: pyrroline-5-carboxylate reductase [Phycisphaerae bacterium]|jgi:pyrroline-5-carboxylate reductase
MQTIGFIGSGNMAEAIIKGLLESKVYAPQNVNVSDLFDARLDYMAEAYGVSAFKDNIDLIASSDVVVLAVKPQVVAEVLEGIDSFPEGKLLISIVAGTLISTITDKLGDIPVIRVMPNTPALVGCGAAGLYGNEKAASQMELTLQIFSSIGSAVCLGSEDEIDTVTAISGSGPAYFFLLMEEMIKAGVELGMDEATVTELTIQTALGAAMLAKGAAEAGQSPEELREKVTSPGGTTAAAIKVFEEDQFGAIVLLAMTRARQRSKELSEI